MRFMVILVMLTWWAFATGDQGLTAGHGFCLMFGTAWAIIGDFIDMRHKWK